MIRKTKAGPPTQPLCRPLAGIRVLDLSDIKGAYCTKLLGALGADVIKVEPPNGVASRSIGPFAGDIPDPERSLVFAYYNCNKRGVTLDIRSKGGKSLLLEMVKRSDVLVESFDPGDLDSMNLGYSRLNKLNPRLVMTSITPFGQSGPRRGHQATELTLLATGGITFVCGEPDDVPCTAPAYMAFDVAGTWAMSGILLALYYRNFSGEGQYIDISILESVASITDWAVARLMAEGTFPTRNGATARTYWPSGLYRTRDGGQVMLFINILSCFRSLNQWIGKEELQDPVWENRDTRMANSDYLREVYQEFIGQFAKEEFVQEAQKRGITATPLNDVAEFQADKHERARHFFQMAKHPIIGTITAPHLPFVVSEMSYPPLRPPPLLGQHNEQVYCKELGLSKVDLITLKATGVT